MRWERLGNNIFSAFDEQPTTTKTFRHLASFKISLCISNVDFCFFGIKSQNEWKIYAWSSISKISKASKISRPSVTPGQPVRNKSKAIHSVTIVMTVLGQHGLKKRTFQNCQHEEEISGVRWSLLFFWRRSRSLYSIINFVTSIVI